MGRLDSRDVILVWSLLLASVFFVVDGLLCDCTEPNCLSQGRSNRCVGDPELGCYKEYYSKMKPQVTMGCVKSLLLCDHAKMRPNGFISEDWPITECCFTDLCNRHLRTPHRRRNVTQTVDAKTSSWPTTQAISEEKPVSIDSISAQSEMSDKDSADDKRALTPVHPLFLLLIALVILFLVVVVASIIIIIRIWLYNGRKSKEVHVNPWKVQEKTDSHTQTAYLLTSDSSSTSSQQTSTNTLLEAFDVP